MNWIFEAYSNVYNTAMGQRTPFHHRPGNLTAKQHRLKRANSKFGM